MKKLSLNPASFQKGEVLSRSELKKVLGGVVEDGGEEGGGGGGTCGVNFWDTHGTKSEYLRGLSKSVAQSEAASLNSNHQGYCTQDCNAHYTWCCASC